MSKQRLDYLEDFVRSADKLSSQDRLNIEAMLTAIGEADLERHPRSKRNSILSDIEGFLVEKVEEFYRPLKFSYDPAKSTWQSIHDLLGKAAKQGKEEPVAKYLVGAKLQLRFPEMQISNESDNTADVQLGRQGDFHIGDTVFHVTVAPMSALYEKCKRNLDEGFKVYLLVPDRLVAGTKQNSELEAAGKIFVGSIESFVSQNIDELSGFSMSEGKKEFRCLLEMYNNRVDAVETNKSMMIEIPVNLVLSAPS